MVQRIEFEGEGALLVDSQKIEVEAIEFECIIRQVKTMSDHSVNVTINLPEYQTDKAAQLMKHIDDFSKGALVFEKKTNEQPISTKTNRKRF